MSNTTNSTAAATVPAATESTFRKYFSLFFTQFSLTAGLALIGATSGYHFFFVTQTTGKVTTAWLKTSLVLMAFVITRTWIDGLLKDEDLSTLIAVVLTLFVLYLVLKAEKMLMVLIFGTFAYVLTIWISDMAVRAITLVVIYALCTFIHMSKPEETEAWLTQIAASYICAFFMFLMVYFFIEKSESGFDGSVNQIRRRVQCAAMDTCRGQTILWAAAGTLRVAALILMHRKSAKEVAANGAAVDPTSLRLLVQGAVADELNKKQERVSLLEKRRLTNVESRTKQLEESIELPSREPSKSVEQKEEKAP